MGVLIEVLRQAEKITAVTGQLHEAEKKNHEIMAECKSKDIVIKTLSSKWELLAKKVSELKQANLDHEETIAEIRSENGRLKANQSPMVIRDGVHFSAEKMSWCRNGEAITVEEFAATLKQRADGWGKFVSWCQVEWVMIVMTLYPGGKSITVSRNKSCMPDQYWEETTNC